jgi:hypothetical protein
VWVTQIRAKLMDYWSPDIVDLRNPGIAEDEPFIVLFQAEFGVEGEVGQDTFNFTICNPQWISAHIGDGILVGRHYLIVAKFDLDEIVRFLERTGKECTGADWTEVATKLARFGHWEFEDYQEAPDPRAG